MRRTTMRDKRHTVAPFARPAQQSRRLTWGCVVAALLLLGGCRVGQPQDGKQPTGAAAGRPGQQQPAGNGRAAPEWKADRYSDPTAAAPTPPVTGCPTRDVAVRAGMSQIMQKYGRETLNRQLPLEAAIDERGVWTVSGTLPPNADGRVNKVRIDSRTGKVLSVK